MPIVHCSFIRFAAWLAAIWLLCGSPLAAQNDFAGEPPRVVGVRVVTESGIVLDENPPKLTLQPGQTYSTESESAGLRELFRSGKYADLRAELADVPGGVRLDFVVRQNLFISRVQIDGLHEPPGEALALSALRLRVGEPFRANHMKEALDRLRQTLEDDGEYQAKLTYATTPHPETQQIDIVVHVAEGLRARVAAITILNQTEFPEQELRSHLKINQGGQMTAERLNRVADRARKWLTQNNFLGARVTIHRGTYDAKTNRVPLNFTMYAGLEMRVAV